MTHFETIRRLSRIPVPEDGGYLFSIGAATYGFAHTTFSLAYVVTYLDSSKNFTDVADETEHTILKMFRSAAAN